MSDVPTFPLTDGPLEACRAQLTNFDKNSSLFVVSGKNGSGKSSVLAKWMTEMASGSLQGNNLNEPTTDTAKQPSEAKAPNSQLFKAGHITIIMSISAAALP